MFLILKKVKNDDVSSSTNFIIKSKHKCCCLWNRHLLFDFMLTLVERQNVVDVSFFNLF